MHLEYREVIRLAVKKITGQSSTAKQSQIVTGLFTFLLVILTTFALRFKAMQCSPGYYYKVHFGALY